MLEEVTPPPGHTADIALANALALMTLWASPCPHCAATHGIDRVRAKLAARIGGHLEQMSRQAELGTILRSVADQLHAQWLALASGASLPLADSHAPGAGEAHSAALH